MEEKSTNLEGTDQATEGQISISINCAKDEDDDVDLTRENEVKEVKEGSFQENNTDMTLNNEEKKTMCEINNMDREINSYLDQILDDSKKKQFITDINETSLLLGFYTLCCYGQYSESKHSEGKRDIDSDCSATQLLKSCLEELVNGSTKEPRLLKNQIWNDIMFYLAIRIELYDVLRTENMTNKEENRRRNILPSIFFEKSLLFLKGNKSFRESSKRKDISEETRKISEKIEKLCDIVSKNRNKESTMLSVRHLFPVFYVIFFNIIILFDLIDLKIGGILLGSSVTVLFAVYKMYMSYLKYLGWKPDGNFTDNQPIITTFKLHWMLFILGVPTCIYTDKIGPPPFWGNCCKKKDDEIK